MQRHNKKKVDDVVEVGADGSLAPPPESGRRRRELAERRRRKRRRRLLPLLLRLRTRATREYGERR